MENEEPLGAIAHQQCLNPDCLAEPGERHEPDCTPDPSSKTRSAPGGRS